jgi:hypothetical protein
MTAPEGERRLRSFVRIVPHALEAMTALELLILRVVGFGLMLYGLVRLVTTH